MDLELNNGSQQESKTCPICHGAGLKECGMVECSNKNCSKKPPGCYMCKGRGFKHFGFRPCERCDSTGRVPS